MDEFQIALIIVGGIVGLYGLFFADERRSHIWCLCGGLVMGPAFARPLANWLWPDPAHEKCACRRCECSANGEEKTVAAPAHEPDAQASVVTPEFLFFEGGESVEGRLDGRGPDGAADLVALDCAAKKALVDQSGERNDRLVVVAEVRGAGTAGEAGEDGELDVVHAADSTAANGARQGAANGRS